MDEILGEDVEILYNQLVEHLSNRFEDADSRASSILQKLYLS